MSAKRKLDSMGLERRVRPRREEEWEPEAGDGSSSDEASEEGTAGDDGGEEDDGPGSDPDSDADSEPAEAVSSKPKPSARLELAEVSFGALARAQAALPPPDRKTKKQKPAAAERRSLRESSAPSSRHKAAEPPPKRSSKNAPQEQSSKRAVSRLREILPDARRQPRDPRFDSLGGPVDEAKSRKAYAFLDEYRESEMAELRAQIKKARDPDAKEELKRQLLSMQSRKKARENKDDAERVVLEHRRQEKELVAQGKTPFYLKRSEQKKRVLMDRFAGMSKGQVNRAIERKRKKVAGKEKKELGSLERVKSRY